MNLQRSTFLVLHIVFMLNRSLISCYVEKKAAMFPAKKGIELCILNSSLAFCLYVLSTLLDITLRRRLCHKQNKEKYSEYKKVAAASRRRQQAEANS